MECPFVDCDFVETKTEKFKYIKTTKLSKVIIRGRACPKCKRSFRGVERFEATPFYKRESEYGYKKIS